MRKDKEEIKKLRSYGWSYNEIREKMHVPKSTLSDWFSKFPWSEEIRNKLAEKSKISSKVRLQELSTIRGEHLKKIYLEAESEALQEYELLKYHPLFITALMIYWGEGDRLSKYRVYIANSEPAMIKVFVYFLRFICQFQNDKIRAWILAYPDLDKEEIKKYWVEKTGILPEQFTKTVVIQGKQKTRRLTNGICSAGVISSYFKKKMLIWLKCFSEDLVSDKYYAGIV